MAKLGRDEFLTNVGLWFMGWPRRPKLTWTKERKLATGRSINEADFVYHAAYKGFACFISYRPEVHLWQFQALKTSNATGWLLPAGYGKSFCRAERLMMELIKEAS